MTLSIDADQATLATRDGVTCLPLVVLETYSDRDAETVSNTYYWTRGFPIRYAWDGGTPVSFDAFVERVSPIERGFSHLPDAGDFSTRETVTVSIDSSERVGSYLWRDLIDDNLLGASITVGSLLVDSAEFDPEATFLDLSALGAAHVVRWRGEVTSIPEVREGSGVFEIVAESWEYELAGRTLSGVSTAHPSDAGKVLPVPIGSRTINALAYDVGVLGTLDAAYAAGASTIVVNVDTDRIPELGYDFVSSASYDQAFAGHLWMNGELVAYESRTVDAGAGQVTFSGVEARAAATEIDDPCGVIPAVLRFAIAGVRVADIESFEVRVGLDGNPKTYTDRNAGSSFAAIWTIEVIDGPDGDPVSLLSVSIESPLAETMAGLVDWENSYVRVTLSKLFEVTGTTPTTLIDITGSGVWGVPAVYDPDAHGAGGNDWTRQDVFDFSSRLSLVHANVDADTKELQYPGADADPFVWAVDPLGGSLVATSVAQRLQFTVELDATELSQLKRLYFGVKVSGFAELKNFWGYRVYLPEDLTAGANVLEVDFAVDPLPSPATSYDFGIIFVWDDVTTSPTPQLTGDLEGLALTISDFASINHPIDVVEYVVDELLPDRITTDATSFAAAKTNTPGLEVSFDLNDYRSLGELLAAIGFNSRINFVLSETATGTEVKAFAADTSYGFAAASRAIGADYENGSLRIAFRQLSEVTNRFRVSYDLDPIAEDLDRLESYRKTLIANEVQNDIGAELATSEITTSQGVVGKRDSIVIPFTMIADEDSAKDVLGYYATEAIRYPVQRLGCVAPRHLAYDLEAGDIVSIEPPHESSALKCRAVRTVFNFDAPGIGVSLEEVP